MEKIVYKIRLKRLELLSDLARMADNRIPMRILFTCLSEPQPRVRSKKTVEEHYSQGFRLH